MGTRETREQRELRDETARLPMAGMQIGADQGALLQVLVRVLRAKRCIEIGTFTGYSALSVALALPKDGKIVCCDVSEEWTSIAHRYWEKAGVEAKIDLRIAPALETLAKLKGKYDFAFIDADKPNYWKYYERCLQLLREGGLVAVDNTPPSTTPFGAERSSNAATEVKAPWRCGSSTSGWRRTAAWRPPSCRSGMD